MATVSEDHPRCFRIVKYQKFDALCNPLGAPYYIVEERHRRMFGRQVWIAATKWAYSYEGHRYREPIHFDSEGDAAVFMMKLYAGEPRETTTKTVTQQMEI